MSSLRLIFCGDDFGCNMNVNAAIVRAHEHGVLTSASLMVTGAALPDAVARARSYPALAVGLHVAVSHVSGALTRAEAPHLIDALGRLPQDPYLTGVRYFLDPWLRAELRREMTAQFDLYRATGLRLAHVDGHFLLHLHPVVFDLLLPLAEAYGVPGIRLPRDDLRLGLSVDRSRRTRKVTWASLYGLLCWLARGRLRRSTLVVTDRVYGLLHLGRMHEPVVLGLIRGMPAHVLSAELFFHPSTQKVARPFGANAGDLAALLSPRVRAAVRERGAMLANYPDLARARGGGRRNS
jgi:chitin disaccharide deacetylase